MPETPSTGIRAELLAAYEHASPEDRKQLRQLLAELQKVLLASREAFAWHLQSFDDETLKNGWHRVASQSDFQRVEEQLSLDFEPPAGTGPIFQAAERPGEYRLMRPVTAEEVFDFVRDLLEARFRRADVLSDPEATKQYLIAHLAQRQREVFATLFLDNRHRVLAFEELFQGTIDGCSVHPREVVKAALGHNAAAVIFAHNHPSGAAEPSQADHTITRRLKDALALIDVRVLDHIVVGGVETVSFAERGLL